MTTISKLAYQIVADTQGFTKGVTLTRNELALTKQAMRESITPAQAYAAELAALDQVAAKGAISQQQYAAAVGKVKAEFYGDLGAKIRNTGAAVAATAGAMTAGLVMIGRDLVNAYAEEEQAIAKLQAAMNAAGTASAGTMDKYKAFAAEMQKLTTTGDETSLGMLQTAESLGVTGDAAERAVRNAIGLQAALGIDAQIAMKMTSALEQGSTTLLTRYLPALRGIEDESQRAAAAQELIGRMFGVAEGEANTYAGASQQLANAYGDLKEQLGSVIAEGLTPIVQTTRDVVASFTGMSDGTKQVLVYTGMAVAGLGAFVTAGGSVVAIAGQMVIWYGALQTSAIGAKVAQLALNSACGVGYVAAAAGAAAAGYALGKSLYDLTETAKVNARVIAELHGGLDSLKSVDVTGTARADLEAYIAATERQIAKVQEHNAELQSSQAWWNFWQSNKDLVQQNSAQIEVLQENLRKAKTELVTGAGTPAVVNQEAIDAIDKYTAKLREQITTVGMDAQALELWKLQQQGAEAKQLQGVEALQRGAAAAAAQAALRNDTQQLVASLQQQIDAVGKTADEVTRLELAARGLSPEWVSLIAAMQGNLAAAQRAQETRQEVDRLSASLRDQAIAARAAALGWSPEQLEIWKLAQRGATQEQLQQLTAMQQAAAAAKRQQDAQAAAAQAQQNLRDNLQQTTARLREQIATAGMSAEQIELWKLAQQGATPQQLAQVRALQAQARALAGTTEEQRKSVASTSQWNAATRGSSEAMDRIEAYRKLLATKEPVTPPKPATPPAVTTAKPPVPAPAQALQPTWLPPPPPPAVAPIEVQIVATWTPIPPPPTVPPPAVAGEPGETASAAEAGTPGGSQSERLLSQAVILLQRIATASEGDQIIVEQTA